MTTFKWTGKSMTGVIQSGEMVAATKDDVIFDLRRQGIIPTSVVEQKKTAPKLRTKLGKVSDKDLVVFTRQFATLFSSGIPIVQGFEILSKQTQNKTLKNVLTQVKESIETGSTVADALRKHPSIFDQLYINLVAAGEAGGVLDIVLMRLANYMEKIMKLKKKVKGAMIYPAIIITVAVLVVAIIMLFVIPIFSKIFSEMGVALPLPTRIVIGLSNFIGGIGGLIILMSIIAFIIAIRQYRKTENGRKVTDRFLLDLPIFGDLIKKVSVARFTRTLGTLIGSGVPILESLEICAKSAGNKIVEKEVLQTKTEVTTGKTISETLSKSKIFSPMVVQMINVGESTGALEQMLTKIADFYDDEVEQAVANLTTLLEPLMIVFLGITIGFIVIALYLPIFKLGGVITGM
ncbi:MAG: type II secretion system F family protein [Thermodesulfovibrionales bacterium]|nr:type II secretion system F family protein [Thermodesulfovibrionales bacterium]